MNQQFLTELKAVTAENRIFTDESMKKHTTFRVGRIVVFSIPCDRLCACNYDHCVSVERGAESDDWTTGALARECGQCRGDVGCECGKRCCPKIN